MSVRIGDHGRTTETAKLLQAQASTADKVRKPAAEKSSRELCSDIPVVKLELSKEGKAPQSMGCGACPLAASCSKINEKCKTQGKGEAE